MDVQHDRLRRRIVVMEHVNQERHDKLHRRVVVVEQKHLVQLGSLQLLLRLFFNFGRDTAVVQRRFFRRRHEALFKIGVFCRQCSTPLR